MKCNFYSEMKKLKLSNGFLRELSTEILRVYSDLRIVYMSLF